jgi:serine/threonine protein kinase
MIRSCTIPNVWRNVHYYDRREGRLTPDVPGLRDLVRIGRGGFGTVFRARDERYDRAVAVKVIHELGVSDDVIARFTRECKALGRLSGHPNIVALYDSGQSADDELYLIMEYLPGGSVAQRIQTGGPASTRTVIDWGVA